MTRLSAALLAVVSTALPAADFADSAKYAWSENAGWLNVKATDGGAQVFSGHLEGYVWHENLGWIRLGTQTGGGTHTYGNSTADNYGVNRSSTTGALSGYAWSENAGWVNFGPSYGGVSANPTTGDLDGYAWSENVGWVRFVPYSTLTDVCGPGVTLNVGLWQQLALPCTPTAGFGTATVTGVFGTSADEDGKLATATYNDAAANGWVMSSFNTATNVYNRLTATDPLTAGTGYWIKSFAAPFGGGSLTYSGDATGNLEFSADCSSPDGCSVIEVQTIAGQDRFNMVSNPFPYPIDWDAVRVRVGAGVYTPTEAQGEGYLSNQIWIWNGASFDTYSDSAISQGQLRYFTSFWVKVLSGAAGETVELLIPRRVPSISDRSLDRTTPAAGADSPWYLAWVDWLIPTAAAEEDGFGHGLPPADRPARQTRPAQAPAEAGQDPTIELLITEGILSQGLSPQAAARAAQSQAIAEGRQWLVRLLVDEPATGYHDHNSVLGQLLTASNGYDPEDLREMPPFGTPYLTLVFPRPQWGANAGDYATDLRAALGPKIGRKPQRILPPADWTFEIRADRPGTAVVLRWEGDPAILKRTRLVDHSARRTLQPGNKRFANGYPVILEGGRRAFTWRYLGGMAGAAP